MNPRKAKELLPRVSETTGIDLQCLKDLTDFYWDMIHTELTSLTSNHVLIPHIGTFNLRSEKKLRKTIEMYERRVYKPRINPPKSKARYTIYLQNEEKLKRLIQLLYNHLEEREKRKKIKLIRQNVRKEKDKQDMGQSQGNPGGPEELHLNQGGDRENSQ